MKIYVVLSEPQSDQDVTEVVKVFSCLEALERWLRLVDATDFSAERLSAKGHAMALYTVPGPNGPNFVRVEVSVSDMDVLLVMRRGGDGLAWFYPDTEEARAWISGLKGHWREDDPRIFETTGDDGVHTVTSAYTDPWQDEAK